MAATTVSGFSALASSGLRLASSVVNAAAGAVLGDGAKRGERRVWAHRGRAHVEVKGLTGHGDRHLRLSEEVTDALRAVKGVHWAEVNAITQHVLVAFDENEVDVDLLVEAIEEAEEAHGTTEEEFDRTKPDHPSAQAPVTEAATALVGDVAGLMVATAGRLFRFPALPAALRVPVHLAESTPRVRNAVEERLGASRTELLLALSNSAINALAQGPAPLVIDGTRHFLSLADARARLAVWHRREAELVGDGADLPRVAEPPVPRPAAFPEGPIERLADRVSLASLSGALGVLIAARSPGRAADLLVAMVPKAARSGRTAFASTLGWELCGRDVVPMNPAVLRRLDRISAVVVDSAVLCSARPRVLSAAASASGYMDADIWRVAEDFVAGEANLPAAVGAWRLRAASRRRGIDGGVDVFDDRDRLCGAFVVGREPDPLADATLAAARSAASRVVVTADDSVSELTLWADRVLPPGTVLADAVRGLQAEGEAVLVLSADHAALRAADVGIGVVGSGPVPWSADLLCGPGLSEAWRLLMAVRTARRVSERSARLALGGSALGALVSLTGRRRRGQGGLLAPVHTAAALAVAAGVADALRLGRMEVPAPVVRADWHCMTAEQALARADRARREFSFSGDRSGPLEAVGTNLRGLMMSAASVPVLGTLVTPARTAAEFGAATYHELHDPLTPVLALGAAASAVIGSGFDAALVGGVMVGNAGVGGFQRLRAERALSGLLLGERVAASVVDWHPNGGFSALDTAPIREAASTRLAIGDVIRVRTGDVVPADARLLAAAELETDESTLTGEPVPVGKSPEPTPGAELDARACMLYEGSTVVAGEGFAVVVATGRATEAGRAAAIAGDVAPAAGIGARLVELTRVALPAAGIGGAAVTGLAALRGVPLRQAVSSGVATAVAAVPEGLPLVATVAQLAGARRLSRLGILVRSSRTLEALGRVDTVCFDKTGTLTQGRLSIAVLADAEGDLRQDTAEGRRVLRVAARACPVNGRFAHATDRAVARAADQAGASPRWQPVAELPFEADRGFAACLGRNSTRPFLAVKGAPETVLAQCTQILDRSGLIRTLTEARRREAAATILRLAGQGLRVLAVAQARPDVEPDPDADVADLVTGLTLVGFLGIADVMRESAAEAVRRLTALGVRVAILTGDHPETAAAVAERLGVPGSDQVVTGAELDALPEDERASRIAEAAVFARVRPEQKVRVVQALRAAGRVVAMAGDGSNDAAAIRLADVGIALAGPGSAAARGAADVVVAEPDPARLAEALTEGRELWDRVRQAAGVLVGGNAGEVAFSLFGTALGGRAPLTTRQLLLVNMLTDMMPALAVALSRPESAAGAGPGAGAEAKPGPLAADAEATPSPHADTEAKPSTLADAEAKPSPHADAAAEARSDERVEPLADNEPEPRPDGEPKPGPLADTEPEPGPKLTETRAPRPVAALWGPELARTLALRGTATALGASLAWSAGRLTGRRRRADTMGLAALVGTQLGQTLLAARGSKAVCATAAGSALVLFAVVETPGVSRFFGCTPLGPVAWSLVAASCAAGTLLAAKAPEFFDRLGGSGGAPC